MTDVALIDVSSEICISLIGVTFLTGVSCFIGTSLTGVACLIGVFLTGVPYWLETSNFISTLSSLYIFCLTGVTQLLPYLFLPAELIKLGSGEFPYCSNWWLCLSLASSIYCVSSTDFVNSWFCDYISALGLYFIL